MVVAREQNCKQLKRGNRKPSGGKNVKCTESKLCLSSTKRRVDSAQSMKRMCKRQKKSKRLKGMCFCYGQKRVA